MGLVFGLFLFARDVGLVILVGVPVGIWLLCLADAPLPMFIGEVLSVCCFLWWLQPLCSS